MGNHSIDCEFCGRDQRLTGPNCCAQEDQRRKAEDDARRAKQAAIADRLSTLGVPFHTWSGDVVKVYGEDLVDWLDRIGIRIQGQ